ncbi:MAG: polyprenyl synthetase family protein [Prevotella nanceiensis]|uniref:polyprenyl synthetase family protein n=1 Tax=Hoylesella nanceiensis TaxID=425941 RepID=UPI001CB009FE|nr:polyprenyl synthetase family protein [Hoylesella nanceiensis]MBF1433241.1 polyprenyl synthetase family protein [Hoylesella nanceiensis]MBF1434149.1 polyprenyl synthetase family protein [Hoylesella nanceiensis]MBF1437301.1 polyprenyl synthetase family protein [Hoylesella nanceiensis]
MDYLSVIKKPITEELNHFIDLFNTSLEHQDGLLSQVLMFIKQRSGKRMRPMLMLLIAKAFGCVSEVTQHAAIGLELLHTASLVHDDVVDESGERRGQASVNAFYDNKVAVLVGDYILSTALLHVSYTSSDRIVSGLAELGRTLSDGEILQLENISNQTISEEAYYEVIKRKTAALFEACTEIGALSVGASKDDVEQARLFGLHLGMAFQIRDDIFDYYESNDIGKPTGNDMAEGKLTLPVIHAVLSTDNGAMKDLALKVRKGEVTPEEVAQLVAFTKENGGIEYAEAKMREFKNKAIGFIEEKIQDADIKQALNAYLDYVIERKL